MPLSNDPTDFDGVDAAFGNGVLPAIPREGQTKKKKHPKNNAATGASAAGVRAFTAQAVAFYFRVPVKAFFRTRVDYLAYARTISAGTATAAGGAHGRYAWLLPYWRKSTPGLLAQAVQTYGWKVIPEQILPPLMANVAVGAVLYTTYLQILGHLHEPSGEIRTRVYPPPSFSETFTAGTLAGGFQSIIAAPLDALQVRYDRQLHHGHVKDQTMWSYGREKLREIGVRGIFAGWGLSFAKDSIGSGVFFSTFEFIKAQGYYSFVKWYYNALQDDVVDDLAQKRPDGRSDAGKEERSRGKRVLIKPHYALEPTFLLLAGVSASIAQQGILYPLTLVQTRHFERLEGLDVQAKKIQAQERPDRMRGRMLKHYWRAYEKTWKECKLEAAPVGGVRHWLFRGFWWNTIRQVPSTSAGLIIFELVRRKYGMVSDEVKISQGSYDILLT